MIKKIIFSLVLIVVAMTSAYFVHAQDVKHKTFATYDEIVAQKKPGIIYFYSEIVLKNKTERKNKCKQ